MVQAVEAAEGSAPDFGLEGAFVTVMCIIGTQARRVREDLGESKRLARNGCASAGRPVSELIVHFPLRRHDDAVPGYMFGSPPHIHLLCAR